MEQIKFKKDEQNITITIPIDILVFAGENHPETPLKVIDKQKFAEKVMFELEHNLGEVESGHTGFTELLDEAMMEVVENAEECVDYKNEEW